MGMAGFSKNTTIIEFDSFYPAFPVRSDEESAVKRRFMTLFVGEGDLVRMGGTSYVCRMRSFTGEEFAVKRLLLNARPIPDIDTLSEDDARALQVRIDAFYQEYCNLLLVSRMRGFPRLYGYGLIGKEPAIVMEWVQGVSVRDFADDYANRDELIPAKVIAALGVSVLDILDSAGSLDSALVHRDISPSNIMIRTERTSVVDQVASKSFDICLIDFGSALADAPRDESLVTDFGPWRNGTPEYAPPEMLARDVPQIDDLRKSQSIDVFALCSVLYELYAGSTPWRVSEQPGTSPFLIKTENEPYPLQLRSAEDADFAQALLDGLSTEQEKRPSVLELEARLRSFAFPNAPEEGKDGQAVESADAHATPMELHATDGANITTTNVDDGGSYAGEDAMPLERSAKMFTRRGIMVGGIALAIAAASGALIVRDCGRRSQKSLIDSPYDFSNYPTTDVVYSGSALYPVMHADGGQWVLRNAKTGVEIEIGSGSREPGRLIEGLFRAFDPTSGNYGFMTAIDRGQGSLSCAWRVLPQYAVAGDFSSSTGGKRRLAAVKDAASGMWGYIDVDGQMHIDPAYGAASRFSNGYAAVRFKWGEPWGLINSSGTQVIPARFTGLGSCSTEGLIAAGEADGSWGFVDCKGKWVLESKFVQVRRFSDGLAACRRAAEALWEYIDVAGNTAIEARFANAFPFVDGLAPAQDAETRLWGLIDTAGSWQVEPRYLRLGEKTEMLLPAHGSPANVYDIGKADKAAWEAYTASNVSWTFGYGLIDEDGEWVVKPVYGDTLIRQPEL